jgi:hypothetical protein
MNGVKIDIRSDPSPEEKATIFQRLAEFNVTNGFAKEGEPIGNALDFPARQTHAGSRYVLPLDSLKATAR